MEESAQEFFSTDEFVSPWMDCLDAGGVPNTCQGCGYLAEPGTVRPEWCCKLIFLYEIKKEDPVCDKGQRIVYLAKSGKLENLMNVVYGWRKVS